MIKKKSDIGKRKEYVISVRIPNNLGEEFDKVASFLPLNKTDFITECVRRLVFDNKFLMDSNQKIEEIIEYIKDELARVPKKNLKVINGNIDLMSNIAIYSLCDFLFSASEDYWKSMTEIKKNLEKKFHVIVGDDEDLFKEYTGEFILDMEDISLMMLPKPMHIPAEDLVYDDKWSDTLETKKMLLILAIDKLLEIHSLKKIISDIIKEENKIKNDEHVLIIDAQGRFRRGKDIVYNPVYLETVEKWKVLDVIEKEHNEKYKKIALEIKRQLDEKKK